MNIKDAVALALIYKQVPKEMYDTCLKLVSGVEDAKMIRFENNLKKVATIRHTCEFSVTLPDPKNPQDKIEAYAYRIRSKTDEKGIKVPEKGWRFLFFSERFTDALSVRFFNNLKGYDRLKKQSKITVKSEINFRGAMLAIYSFEGSDVERVAIYCEEYCDLTPDMLTKKLAETSTNSADKTSFF